MYYVVVVLVQLFELHFVDFARVLCGDPIALFLGEIPIPQPVERACDERHG